jgi:hypothetical protein
MAHANVYNYCVMYKDDTTQAGTAFYSWSRMVARLFSK